MDAYTLGYISGLVIHIFLLISGVYFWGNKLYRYFFKKEKDE